MSESQRLHEESVSTACVEHCSGLDVGDDTVRHFSKEVTPVRFISAVGDLSSMASVVLVVISRCHSATSPL